MKKLNMAIGALFILVSTSAFAGSCDIPEFLKKGMTFEMAVGMGSDTVKVVKIDKKACWIKVHDKDDDVSWLNLSTVIAMAPQTKDSKHSADPDKDPKGYGKVRWGMSENDIKNIYPNISYASVRVNGPIIHKLRFRYDQDTKLLRGVEVACKGSINLEQVKNTLKQKYGQGMRRKDVFGDVTGLIMWMFPSTEISIRGSTIYYTVTDSFWKTIPAVAKYNDMVEKENSKVLDTSAF